MENAKLNRKRQEREVKRRRELKARRSGKQLTAQSAKITTGEQRVHDYWRALHMRAGLGL